jgi:hypothetical protein
MPSARVAGNVPAVTRPAQAGTALAIVLLASLAAINAYAAPRRPQVVYPAFDVTVTSFNPTTQGFDFTNHFSYDLSVSVDGKKLQFSGGYGLCGGMTYAALDTFYASNGTTAPPGPLNTFGGSVAPQSGPLYQYFVNRQYASLGGNVLLTLLKYEVSPQETSLGVTGLDEMSYKAFTNQIVPAINAGHPVPILLLENRANPADDHQELVIGYFRRVNPGGQAVLEVYDPNYPDRVMYLNTAEKNPTLPSRTESSDMAGQNPVGSFLGFFVTNDNYSANTPYWANAQPTGNLLQDPAGGGVIGASNQTSVVDPPSWDTTGSFTVAQYGAPGFPASPGSGGPNLFAGGPATSPVSSAREIIPLTTDASQFNTGDWSATLSADLGGYASQPYEMVLTADFLNTSGVPLSTITVGPISAAERQAATELLPVSATARVPAGTTTVRVTMTAAAPIFPGPGGYNTAFADDVSLVLTKPKFVFTPVPPIRRSGRS